MAATSASPSQNMIPRPSASVIIVNSRNEVLLVHRNPQARHFGGVHVFPGGNLDKKQDVSLATTAIRETFEESGLLLASATSGSATVLSDAVLDEARMNIHAQKLNFQTFLSNHQLVPDTNSLLPFTQWITPVNVLRRFHTQFFVTFLPAASSSGFSYGAKQDRIPKPDGGQEVVSARFLHPADALSEFSEGKITFMPPQAYLLQTLAEVLQGRENTPEQRERVQTLSRGFFGRMVINPRRLGEPDAEGRTILTYEGDETRGGSKGRLHRVLVKFGKGALTSEVRLQRNFDIFTEIEPQAFAMPSKL
ncbi:putative NUDIX domain containing protein [Lyophyllum shimeji]|uniref:NUDIX domain containing protein n=1 Tax=Lyophyllum shimeji TaxID=47721 RepID=A0A9P3PF20_LYOSH|nr:putative NUDIX domain containing protein [Lyophyllum shimeji]